MFYELGRNGQTFGRSQGGLWGRLIGRFIGPARSLLIEEAGKRGGIERTLAVSFKDKKLCALWVREKCEITCIEGSVWVTPQQRRCDYILEPGESLVLRQRGKILISGSGTRDSSIQVVYS